MNRFIKLGKFIKVSESLGDEVCRSTRPYAPGGYRNINTGVVTPNYVEPKYQQPLNNIEQSKKYLLDAINQCNNYISQISQKLQNPNLSTDEISKQQQLLVQMNRFNESYKQQYSQLLNSQNSTGDFYSGGGQYGM